MSTKKKPNSVSPLRAALRAKTSLRTHYELPIVDQDQVEAAKRQLDVAMQLAAGTLLHDDPDVHAKANEALERARAARDACFHRIEFRGLGLDDFDDLVKLHPATPEQEKDPEYRYPWDRTFEYALLAEATIDGDLTAEEWEAELADQKKWPAPDRARLLEMCFAAQRQTMADAIPKG